MPSYCVSGAGSSQANGTYSYNSVNGSWEKVGNTSIYFSYDYDYDSFRLIDGTMGNMPLYAGTFYQTNPSLITWATIYGTSPAPTMASGECTVTLVDPYCVAGADNAAVNGTYTYNAGTFNYYMSDGYWELVGSSIKMGYDSMMSTYTISLDYSVYYTAASLTGPWSVAFGGSGTAPTVTAGACGATSTPTVTSISPSTGTTAGGTSVTITGTGFTGATGVTIGGTAATSITVVSSTSITATTPAKTAGTASVLVTTAGGTNTANTLFTYTTPTPTPNTIRIKRSSTTTATPTSLLEGELAANISDLKLWIGNSSKTPVLISDYKATGTVTSVAMTVPTGLSVTGTPVTTSGTLAITLTSGYSIPTTSSQTNWDSAFTQRLQWDGGSTNLNAATGRTSLGATTVGSNLFTLTNPSAVTFPRFNADNTVSALTAVNFRTAIGAGTSSTTGTVT
jgi:hypothetical protein